MADKIGKRKTRNIKLLGKRLTINLFNKGGVRKTPTGAFVKCMKEKRVRPGIGVRPCKGVTGGVKKTK